MLLFVDIQFDEVSRDRVDIISIGATNGRHSFYGELPPKKNWSSDFVKEYVAPLLGEDSFKVYLKKVELFSAFEKWISNISNGSSELIFDSVNSAQLVRQSLFDDVKTRVIPNDVLRSHVFIEAYNSVFDPIMKPQHHALHDAQAIRVGYLAANLN